MKIIEPDMLLGLNHINKINDSDRLRFIKNLDNNYAVISDLVEEEVKNDLSNSDSSDNETKLRILENYVENIWGMYGIGGFDAACAHLKDKVLHDDFHEEEDSLSADTYELYIRIIKNEFIKVKIDSNLIESLDL